MRRRWPWAVGIAIGAALFATWIVILLNPPEPRLEGLAAPGDRPFGDGTLLPGDVIDASYSPDGRHLLVRGDDGLALAKEATLHPLGPRTGSIAAAAWFPTSQLLLVAEGPARTGQLAVLDLQGESTGVVDLDPDVGFASGHGLAVLPGGRTAVAVTVERDPVGGGATRSLTAIELATGATRTLPVDDPTGPVFATDRGALVTVERAPGRPCVVVVDPVAAAEPPCLMQGRAVGAALGFAYGVRNGVIHVVPLRGGDDEALTGTVESEGVVVTAVAPDGGSIVLRDRTGLRRRPIPGPPA